MIQVNVLKIFMWFLVPC